MHAFRLASGPSDDARPRPVFRSPGSLNQAVGLAIEAIDQFRVTRFGGEAVHGLDQAVDRKDLSTLEANYQKMAGYPENLPQPEIFDMTIG